VGGSAGVGAGDGGGGSAGASGGDSGGSGDGGVFCGPGTPQTGGKTLTSAGQGPVTGAGGYSYSFFLNGGGSASMTIYDVAAQFSASWSGGVGDFLARVGLGFNETQTPTQIGTIAATFSETKTGVGGGFSYIGIYGWSVNPLHEYYIVDDWFGSPPFPGTKMGTITVDGGTYDVFTHTQENQPSITGANATFEQFLSVRQTARTCGTISISEHFSQWASMGLQLGNLEEARILVEVGGSSGSGGIDFTTATVTLTPPN
jgi:endo-1,4-beta-xylanase